MAHQGFESIQGLECSERLLNALREQGIATPNDMQRSAIAAALGAGGTLQIAAGPLMVAVTSST